MHNSSPPSLQLSVHQETWPIAGQFTISRGSKTAAEVVVVTLKRGNFYGRGECLPYSRYGETVPAVMAELEKSRSLVQAGLLRENIPKHFALAAARNALDCALWDLSAKETGIPCWQQAGLKPPQPLITAFTLSLDSAPIMAEAAAKAASHHKLLKLKLGAEGDVERLKQIRNAAPKVRLIVDANEGWQPHHLQELLSVCAQVGVELVEQPLPADQDHLLQGFSRNLLLCADESLQTTTRLDKLVGKYDAVNLKLDKAGGLTPALVLAQQAQGLGLEIMVGCMLSTSLSMAPASLLGQYAHYVDLDGPLLLAKDREPAMRYSEGQIYPAPPALWG